MAQLGNRVRAVDTRTNSARKRLGQYFTGPQLARLLAYIANAERASSVIDPMCGTGDMLKAVEEINPNALLAGIEIDTDLIEAVKPRLKPQSRTTLILGNAFDRSNLQELGVHKFDLVITNPPYVRYQTMADAREESDTPTASRIREDLLGAANYLITDLEDRDLFCKIIRSYSGLSDLAVPSWILSIMLVKVGGTLALVVPESWLSRNYAQIIQYILFRWFRVQYIVEDTNASWFPDALVKTTLLVAERIHRRPSAFAWEDETYSHVRISEAARSETSLIGNVFPDTSFPEKRFADELKFLLLNRQQKETVLWSTEAVRLSETADNLKRTIQSVLWFQECEERYGPPTSRTILPIDLRRWLGDDREKQLTSLSQISVEVGQGLRTGANPFFYVEAIEEHSDYSTVAPHKMFGIDSIRVPAECLRIVLRKQSELPNGYRITKDSLKGRVLILDKDKISGGLKELVKAASRARIGTKYIPELSAVKTNVRRAGVDRKTFANWYTLPSFAPRHTSALLVPRVNGGLPHAYANSSGVVVDANFSTIWLNSDSAYSDWALLALLNSSWSIAAMELIGSVMGGGALKLEATHLKKIPIPILTSEQINRLHALGESLARSGDPSVLDQIDELVVRVFFGEIPVQNKIDQIKQIARRRLDERLKRT